MSRPNLALRFVVVAMLVMIVGSALMGSGVAPSAYNLIQNNTVSVTRRSTLNFVNGGCADNAGTLSTDCTFLTAVPANASCSFTSQTSVTCTHNLNTLNPIVAVYDAASPPNLIFPTTERITSANVVTVTFSSSQSGKVVVSGASGSGTSGVSQIVAGTNVTISPVGGTGVVTINSTGGGGGGTIPQTGWSVVNAGGHAVYNDFSASQQALSCTSVTGDTLRGLQRTLPSSTSYTIISQISVSIGFNVDAAGGLLISDGTKFIDFGLGFSATANQPLLRVLTWTNSTTPNTVLAGPTGNLQGSLLTLKIVGDAVHRTYSYWSSGAYTQFYQEPIGTFLTETTGGIYCLNADSSTADWTTTEMLSWALTNP
jgi:hypothetical protein